MESRIRYRRTFLIFDQEDVGFGAGQEPSGYIKLEVRDGKGKLSLSVQNLKEDPAKAAYKLYIIKCDENQVIPVRIGGLTVKRNKAELEWEFNPENVGMSGISIDEFNIAAVIAEDLGKKSNGLVCPLAAYKGEKIQWRNKVEEKLYNVRAEKLADEEKNGILQREDGISKFEGGIISKYTGLDNYTDTSKIKEENFTYDKPNMFSTADIQDIKDGTQGNNPENENTAEEISDALYNYNKDNLLENNSSKLLKNLEKNFVSPCRSCQERNIRDRSGGGLWDLNRLKECFDRYFESYNPFGSGRRNYVWWKVGNPTSLNNILYSFNLKNPLLFNPKVLMACYKYRHLTIGIYDDMAGGKKYIVCGIPGVYGIDDRPFGAACKWVQVEGSRPRYGTFGYWLVYMDAKTGRLIS